jgi:hypothetical protein
MEMINGKENGKKGLQLIMLQRSTEIVSNHHNHGGTQHSRIHMDQLEYSSVEGSPSHGHGQQQSSPAPSSIGNEIFIIGIRRLPTDSYLTLHFTAAAITA